MRTKRKVDLSHCRAIETSVMVRRTTSALRCSIRLVCSLEVGRGEREREGGGREVYTHLFT